MELLLIRHALPVRRELTEGRADPELADIGRQQAAHLATYLADERIDALYASPMLRARQTAMPVGESQHLELVVEDGVAEYDRDANWYVPVEELKAAGDPRWQEILDGTWHTSLDIDPFEFRDKAYGSIERIVAAHPGQKVAIVCHGGVINAYFSRILDLDDPSGFFYPNYTSIHRVMAARSGERSILTLNETAHLRGTGLPTGINS
jgi:2,3-bisphosphoglycerate-dependent phosphoglycerate mutase